ncbi:keratin, type 1 cytoskeletal 11-like [Amblyraja radiata]|uniref:keratin, type 1 cytoskeletal 11-like n=1 Tax=Amblyraja radiata TaxID=386614 RepID=UPI001403B7CB|nr:keratin, type 1 cytoskeletal 11-like [Amblyraja radiata]
MHRQSTSFSQRQSSGGGGSGSFRRSTGGSFGGSGFSIGSGSSIGYGFGGGSGGSSGYAFGGGGGGGMSAAGSFSSSSCSASSSLMGGAGGLIGNEKHTMITLNDRLAIYLEKVRSLEKANTELEVKLRAFQVGTALKPIDYAAYDAIIKPIRDQILKVHLANARVALDLDNASLAARDFQSKYENEFNTRQMVEGDIMDLKAMKEEYIRNCKDMEGDMTATQEEMVYLRKNHEEELVVLRQQVAGTVSVQVDSSDATDLSKLLADMRAKHEASCKANQDAMKTWYESQVQTQTVAAVQVNEAAEGAKLQLTELKRQWQALQTEYDSLCSAVFSLETSVAGIQDNYAGQLSRLTMSISSLEMELGNLRNDVAMKTKEYSELLNIKMQLEKEIATYRELLQGSGFSQSISGGQETSNVTVVKTIETRTVRS